MPNILNKIKSKKVFAAYVSEDKKHLRLVEYMGNYHSINLSKEETIELIYELKDILNQMEY